MKRLTAGRGVDVVYDSVGKTTFEQEPQFAAPARLAGAVRAIERAGSALRSLHPQRQGLAFLTRPSLGHYLLTRDELLWRAGDVLGWIAAGKLQPAHRPRLSAGQRRPGPPRPGRPRDHRQAACSPCRDTSMNLKARLTLSFVLLAVLLAGTISCVDLAGDINQQFAATLERAENLRTLAADLVGLSLNRQLTKPLAEAVRDPEVSTLLRDTMLASHAIVEIAVLSPGNEILADSIPDEIGKVQLPYDDFRPVVARQWLVRQMARVARRRNTTSCSRPLGPRNGPPILFVRVVVAPRADSRLHSAALEENAIVALFSVLGAALVTMLVSAVAFRPLSRLRRQIESMTSGENPPEIPTDAKAATDDLSVISSRVAQLGLQLRGAQFEVSDLRGNLGRLLRDLEDAVFLFNREGRLVFASGTVEKFTGLDAAALTGKTIAGVFSPESLLGQVIAQATANGLPLNKRRVEVGTGNSSSTVAAALLSVDPLEQPAGGAGSGTLIRLRDPEAQRKLGRELQTADRLAALSRVSGGVAHEVKNPLNAILLHVEVARAKLAHGDTASSRRWTSSRAKSCAWTAW